MLIEAKKQINEQMRNVWEIVKVMREGREIKSEISSNEQFSVQKAEKVVLT